jgi:hypothetical protein
VSAAAHTKAVALAAGEERFLFAGGDAGMQLVEDVVILAFPEKWNRSQRILTDKLSKGHSRDSGS